jgi:hypothetical protein
MRELSGVDRSRVANFIAEERTAAPDWFLSDSASHFAAPAEVVLYFSAFCVGLAHVNSALKEMDSILKRVKSIIANWSAITTEKAPEKDKKLRLKGEEKIIVTLYRAHCAGKKGLDVGAIAHAAGVVGSDAERLLQGMAAEGVLSQGKRSLLWSLRVS